MLKELDIALVNGGISLKLSSDKKIINGSNDETYLTFNSNTKLVYLNTDESVNYSLKHNTYIIFLGLRLYILDNLVLESTNSLLNCLLYKG